jgi:hypothetical protein
MDITTNLFTNRKCGKDVTRNVHINEARIETLSEEKYVK